MDKVKHSYSNAEVKKEILPKDIEGSPIPPDAIKGKTECKVRKHHGKKPTIAKCRT